MSDPALLTSITFYSAGIYPKFEQMGYAEAQKAANFCSDWSNEYPLWTPQTTGFFAKKSGFPTREIPGFGERSSVYAMAVMAAFLVWTQRTAGNELPSSEMLEAADAGYKLCYGWKEVKKDGHTKPAPAEGQEPEGEK